MRAFTFKVALALTVMAAAGEMTVHVMVAHGAPSRSALPQKKTSTFFDFCRKPAPTTTSQFNTMLGSVQGWQAGDGGATALLDHGRRAWSFGDSLLADNRLHHNALVIQDKGCAKSVQTNDVVLPSSYCGDDPATSAEEGYCWGGPVAYAAGKLYMLASAMEQKPDCTGAWCFQATATIVFKFNVPANGTPVIEDASAVPATNGIFWNSALTISSDGQVAYVYGYRDDGDPWTFGYDAYLAVTNPAGLLDPDSWAYRAAGDTWSHSATDAAPILAAAGGPETGWSVTATVAGWVLTSTADGGLGHVVTEWTSPNAWGTWTPHAIADYPDTADHLWYLPQRIAGTSVHVISQNWPNRPLSDIPAHPADFRVVAF